MDDVVAVVTDLMSQSRITAAARPSGRRVRFITTMDEARGTQGHHLALVDLDARVDVSTIIGLLKLVAEGPVVAYGPHLEAEKLKSARAAGADRVLARSRFVSELPAILAIADPALKDRSAT